MIRSSLCSALVTIANKCVKHLAECLGTEDLLKVKLLWHEETQLGMASKKIKKVIFNTSYGGDQRVQIITFFLCLEMIFK